MFFFHYYVLKHSSDKEDVHGSYEYNDKYNFDFRNDLSDYYCNNDYGNTDEIEDYYYYFYPLKNKYVY